MSRIAVPSSTVHSSYVKRVSFAAAVAQQPSAQLDSGGAASDSGKDAVRAFLVCRRIRNQVEAIGTVKRPNHVQMRETLDVGEACSERFQNLEFAFGLMFGATARAGSRTFL